MADPKTATKTATRPATKPAAANKEKLISVYLQRLPEDGGVTEVDQRVTVTVNGENKILLRGQRIEVTLPEYEALLNSGRFETL